MLTLQEISEFKIKFETHGFCHVRNVIPPAVLDSTRASFESARVRHEPNRGTARTTAYFDIPHILDCGEPFIDLVDLPQLFPLLVELIGEDIQLNHTMARLFYPGPTFTSPFHSDLTKVLGVSHENTPTFLVKVHYYLDDLAQDQGCLAFIPGSHRYPASKPNPKNLNPENEDLVVKIVPRAGDAIIFNTHVLHMALDNTNANVRRSLIYAYSHFWLKNYSSGVPRDVERFASNTQRKQLFGVDAPGITHFDRRLSNRSTESFSTKLRVSGKQLVKRMLGQKVH
jgi:phytanoyl-CoA hydroxylase